MNKKKNAYYTNMTLKEGQFIELDYTARITETDEVFDTTYEDVAEEHGLKETKEHSFAPIIVCIGEGHIIEGLDQGLIGKEKGEHSFDIKPPQAFGKKNPELIQIIPEKEFKKQNMTPRPGLEINVDGEYGVIKKTGGGRVVVDFNHPLSGKEISYDVEVHRVVEDKKEQAESLLEKIGMPYEDLAVEDKEAKVTVNMDLPDEFKENLNEEFKRILDINITVTVQGEEDDEE